MKPVILFLAMLLTCVASFAQYPSLIGATSLGYKNGSYSDSILITWDTTTYSYSAGRSGDLTHVMKYDTSITYDIDSTSIESYTRIMQTFSAANNIISRLYQTDTTGTGTWKNTTQYLFNYDDSNNVIAQTIQQWTSGGWSNWSYDTLAFNTDNEVLMHTSLIYSGSAITSRSQNLFAYNTAHNLTTVTTLGWDTTTLSWDSSEKTVYYYNAAGQDTTSIDQYLYSTGWTNGGKTIYTYWPSGLPYYTTFQGWNPDSSSWHNISSMSYGYDGYGRTTADSFWLWLAKSPLEITTQYLDFTGPNYGKAVTSGWSIDTNMVVGVMQDSLTYNSYGQTVTSIYKILWGTGPGIVPPNETPGHHYYYAITTAVVPQLTANIDVQAYPVPANDMLHVSINRQSPQGGSITLTDIEGRVVSRVPVPATQIYNGTIPVSNLPAGTYVLSVTGDDGSNSVKKISIVR